MEHIKHLKDKHVHGNDGGPIIMEQIPVSTNKSTQVWFEDHDHNTFLRIIVTNDRPVSGFSLDTEYWYTSTDISITGVSSITFRSQSGLYSEAALLAYVSGFSKSFETRQNIGTAGWTEGTYSPTATKKRLYKAVDPDNSSHQIGLLIEQNSTNALTAITWYKQTNTSGTVFGTRPTSLVFSLVTYENVASTDPSHIASGTWYYAHAS